MLAGERGNQFGGQRQPRPRAGRLEAGPRTGPTSPQPHWVTGTTVLLRGRCRAQAALPHLPPGQLLCWPNSRPARTMPLEGPEMALTMAEADTQCSVHSAERREGPAGLSLPQGRPCPQAQSVSGPASPTGSGQLRDTALVKAKRHQHATSPREGPNDSAARGTQGPRTRARSDRDLSQDGPNLTVSTLATRQCPPVDRRGLTTGHTPPPLPMATEGAKGQGPGGTTEGSYRVPRGPELLVLGSPAHSVQAWSAASAIRRGRPLAGAAGQKVSGTEVYFQVTVGPRPHSPTCTYPQGLTGGGEGVQASLSLPFYAVFILKKNK